MYVRGIWLGRGFVVIIIKALNSYSPHGKKTVNVRVYAIEKILKQSLKTLCSSLWYG